MAIINVTNPGSGQDIRPNLQTAINAANSTGDTIILPAGTFTYVGTITTTKRFTLKGVTPAVCTWNGFANDYLIESSAFVFTTPPSTIIYRPDSIPDVDLGTLDTSAIDGPTYDGTPAVPMIRFNDSAGSPQTSVTTDGVIISDIEFRSKTPSINGYPANGGSRIAPDSLSLAADHCLYFNKSVDFQVTRCVFKYFGYSAIYYAHWDSIARGVVYKCYFDQNAKGSDGLGLGYGIVVYGQNLSWITNPKFGTDNFLFIENCYFNMHRHSIAGGGCGRYVARYNYIQDNIVTYLRSCHAIDGHGRRAGSLGSGNYFATNTIEAYNNKIINQYRYDGTHTGAKVPIGGTTDVDDLIERGIWTKESFALVYNNIVKGYRFGTGVQVEYIDVYSDGNTGYPQKYTFGEPSAITGGSANPNGDLGDSWFWNNTVHILGAQAFNFFNNTTSIFQENRDYHLSAYAYTNADSAGTGTSYTYPHPIRDDLNPIIISSGRRNFRTRIFHNK